MIMMMDIPHIMFKILDPFVVVHMFVGKQPTFEVGLMVPSTNQLPVDASFWLLLVLVWCAFLCDVLCGEM